MARVPRFSSHISLCLSVYLCSEKEGEKGKEYDQEDEDKRGGECFFPEGVRIRESRKRNERKEKEKGKGVLGKRHEPPTKIFLAPYGLEFILGTQENVLML